MAAEVTELLRRLDEGDPRASAELLPLVYDELRRLAARELGDEPPGHTLSPTALVHEAYLRLEGSADRPAHWNSRGHFYGAAARAMQRILVENARGKRAEKRGGGAARRSAVDPDELPAPTDDDELLALDEALTRLEAERPDLAEVVRLRYFAGLSMPQVAELLELPLRTAERNWTYARAWLRAALSSPEES